MNKNQKIKKMAVREFLVSTAFLYYASLAMWLLSTFFVAALPAYIYGRHLSDLELSVGLSLSPPWAILACMVVIVREEVPRFAMKSIVGRWAVLQGILGLIFFGGIEIFALYFLFLSALGK